MYYLYSDNIIFCNSNEIKKFISDDKDNYIKKLTQSDLHARNVSTNDEYLNIALDSVDDFTFYEKIKLNSASSMADTFTHKYLDKKIFNNIPWKIGKIRGTQYESGFPHTRSDIIFLNDTFISELSKCKIAKTLIHEKIHLYQRLYPEKIQDYLSKFKKISYKQDLTRANPDTDNYIYEYNDIIMNAEYNSKNPRNISDIKLKDITYEHPHEYMAYEIIKKFKC